MKDFKLTVDLKRVGRVVWGIGKVGAVLLALSIGTGIITELDNIAHMLLYLVQFMSKSVGA